MEIRTGRILTSDDIRAVLASYDAVLFIDGVLFLKSSKEIAADVQGVDTFKASIQAGIVHFDLVTKNDVRIRIAITDLKGNFPRSFVEDGASGWEWIAFESHKYMVGPVTITCRTQGFVTLIPVWAEVVIEPGEDHYPDTVHILKIATTAGSPGIIPKIDYYEDDCEDIIFSRDDNFDRRKAFKDAVGSEGYPDSYIERAVLQCYADKTKI